MVPSLIHVSQFLITSSYCFNILHYLSYHSSFWTYSIGLCFLYIIPLLVFNYLLLSFFPPFVQNTNPISFNYHLPGPLGIVGVKSLTRNIYTCSPNSAGSSIALAGQSSFSSLFILQSSAAMIFQSFSTLLNPLTSFLHFSLSIDDPFYYREARSYQLGTILNYICCSLLPLSFYNGVNMQSLPRALSLFPLEK